MSFTLTAYPDRLSWLEARRLSIGSSDAAGLLGESSWSSPTQLNFLKRGLIPLSSPDTERDEALDWHRRREAEVADWWWSRQLFGPKGRDSDDWEEFVSRPQHEKPLAAQEPGGVEIWNPGEFTIASRTLNGVPLSATLDRALVSRERLEMPSFVRGLRVQDWDQDFLARAVVAPVELKNAKEFMRRWWTTSEPPLIYQLQLQHQLLVTGCRYGYLVASIGGEPPVWAEVPADPEMHRILLRTYARFWQSVMDNVDLPADYSDVTAKAISARYPKDNGATILLPEEAQAWWAEYQDAHETLKPLEEKKAAARNNLKQAIGEASYGRLPDGTILSLIADKNGKRTTIRVKGEEVNL